MNKGIFTALIGASLGLASFNLQTGTAIAVNAASENSVVWDFKSVLTGSTNYGNEWEYGNVCYIEGAANNNGNNGWNYLRVGGKSTTNADGISSIRSVRAMEDPVDHVTLDFSAFSSGSGYTLNSISLQVSTNDLGASGSSWADQESIDVVTTSDFGSKTIVFYPTGSDPWPAYSFFRFTFSASITSSSNRGCDLYSIEFSISEGTAAKPESITISSESLLIDKFGGAIQLEANVLPEEASQTVIWKSENEDLATVSQTGLVTAKYDEGTVDITATSRTDESISATVTVTIDFDYGFDASDMFMLPDGFPEETAYEPTLSHLSNGYPFVRYEARYQEFNGLDEISIFKNGYIANVLSVAPIARITLFPASNPQYNNAIVSLGSTFATNGSYIVTPTKVGETVNGDTYWTYEPGDSTEYSYFKIAASSNYNQFLTGIIIEYATDAHDWASMFLDDSGAICGDTQLDHSFDESGIWEEYADLYDILDEDNKGYLAKDYDVLGGQAMTDIQKAVERYKWIATHYADKGLEPFMDGVVVNSYVRPMNSLDTSDSLVITAGILTLAVLTAGVGYFFYKKRREAQR